MQGHWASSHMISWYTVLQWLPTDSWFTSKILKKMMFYFFSGLKKDSKSQAKIREIQTEPIDGDVIVLEEEEASGSSPDNIGMPLQANIFFPH